MSPAAPNVSLRAALTFGSFIASISFLIGTVIFCLNGDYPYETLSMVAGSLCLFSFHTHLQGHTHE